MAFWRASTWKFFAISEAEFLKLSENYDDIRSTSRKRYRASNYNCNKSQDQSGGEVREFKAEISKCCKLAFKHRFSLSFFSVFKEAFQCCICKPIPANAPIIACSNCSILKGCETCTDDWCKNSIDKRCLKCRAARGLSKTFILKGFDDLIEQIKMISDQNDVYTDTVLLDKSDHQTDED